MVEILFFAYISRAMSDFRDSVGPINHFELNGAKYMVFSGVRRGGAWPKVGQNSRNPWKSGNYLELAAFFRGTKFVSPDHAFNCSGVGLYSFAKKWLFNENTGLLWKCLISSGNHANNWKKHAINEKGPGPMLYNNFVVDVGKPNLGLEHQLGDEEVRPYDSPLRYRGSRGKKSVLIQRVSRK